LIFSETAPTESFVKTLDATALCPAPFPSCEYNTALDCPLRRDFVLAESGAMEAGVSERQDLSPWLDG